MRPVDIRNKAVHRAWRKQARALFTSHSGAMSSLLTDLLTASADAQGQLSSQSERSKLTLQVELCWSCVRLGFSGSLGLTMPQDVARPMDLVLRDAFECGLRLRNGHGERLKAAQFVSPPKGKAALRSLPHGSAADTLATP